MRHYQIIIVGGGFAGGALLHALPKNYSVAIIDKGVEKAIDNRGIAVTRDNVEFLERQITLPGKYAINKVHVSERGAFGFTKLAEQYPLGYVISAAILQQALARPRKQATYFTNGELISANLQKNWQLTIKTTHKVEQIGADLLIGADGGSSMVSKIVGCVQKRYDYQQTALVANILPAKKHQGVAYERFTEDGSIAMLPFGDLRMKFVWVMHNNYVSNIKRLTAQQILIKIQQLFGYRLGKLLKLQDIQFFPIMGGYNLPIAGKKFVLIGNAANVLHPVVAGGLNLGLRDVRCLTDLLQNKKIDAVVDDYIALRNFDHKQTRVFADSVTSLFYSKHYLAKFARRKYMLLGQFVPLVQRTIFQYGQGLYARS